MAAKKSAWTRFPHPDKGFDYAGDKLKKAWPSLHAGDAEPFPDDKRAAALAKAEGEAKLAAWNASAAGAPFGGRVSGRVRFARRARLVSRWAAGR